jgi:bifunctional non-homologous end joining protein LigD
VVEVDGRRVRLTHLDRVVYPTDRMTKGEVITYYVTVAPHLLKQLRDRPVTRIRFPEGVEGQKFFEKNVPRGMPSWVRHQTLSASPGADDEGTVLDLPFIDDVAGIVWLGNQSALELHTPQWRVGPRGAIKKPDRLVIDLDPGPPAGLEECAKVAHVVAARLATDGLRTIPVTSGSKGMQLYAPLDGKRSVMQIWQYARDLAYELAGEHPKTLVANMKKDLRRGKVLLDWSQNHPAKTTITPYSLRAREHATVAAPRRWSEVEPGMRQLTCSEVLERIEADGDLMDVFGAG